MFVWSPRRRDVRDRSTLALAAVIALVAGTGVAMLVVDRGDSGGRSPFDGPASVASFPFETAVSVSAPIETAYRPIDPDTEPPSARRALEQFLAAERDGDARTAFSLLDPRAQAAVATPAGWQQQRATRLIAETFEIQQEATDRDGVMFTVRASRTASVDRFAGFVPGSSTDRWSVTDEGGRWRMRTGRPSAVEPSYPSDVVAKATADRWLTAAVACDLGRVEQHELPTLLGDLGVRTSTCDVEGLRVTEVVPFLDLADVSPFVAAYGPSVGRWGRAAHVEGTGGGRNVDFYLALAPLGTTWRVMGFVPGSKGGF